MAAIKFVGTVLLLAVPATCMEHCQGQDQCDLSMESVQASAMLQVKQLKAESERVEPLARKDPEMGLTAIASDRCAYPYMYKLSCVAQEEPCGFSYECPLNYTIASVNASAALSSVSVDDNVIALSKIHEKQRNACLAGADILEEGGWCYDATGSRQVMAVEGKIDKDYLLPPFHVREDDYLVSVLAEKVLLKEDGSCCHSITDLGAGVGQYGHALKARHSNLVYLAYDGAGNVEEYTENYVKFVDLTIPLSLPPTDWLLTSEVGEHIPHEFEKQYIANIHAHNCKGVILTWAVVGQGGHGHVNCHGNEYIIKIFEELGYRVHPEFNAAVRKPQGYTGGNGELFERTAMAFERITKPAHCL